MAYTPATLRLGIEIPGVIPMKVFAYDTVDALATIYAAGYISDATKKGMQKGDIVKVRRWTTSIPAARSELITAAAVANVIVTHTTHMVIGISSAGAADLTDGLATTMTNT